VDQSGVERTKAQTVLDSFSAFFDQASEWETKTKGLVIRNASNVAEMKMAREGRLQLKDIRVNAEKTKKKLKENILIEGRFIDSIYNLIEGVTKPIEAELLEKEKYVERQEEARKAAIRNARIELLAPYEVDHAFYDLTNMPEESFAQLLENSKVAKESRDAAQRKIEEDRIAREKAEAEERARVALENAKLKAEAEKREKEIAEERARVEAERRAREASEKAEVDKQAALLRKAQEEAEKARKELQAKVEAEAKAKRDEAARVEAEKLAKLKAEKELAKAGDRGKVLAYIGQLESVAIPSTDSPEASALVDTLIDDIARAKSVANKL
jgi:hypothetical protein